MSMEMEEKILEDAPTTFKSSSTKRALWIVVVTLAVVLVLSLAVVFALAIALGVEKADSSDDDTSAVEAPTSAPTSAVEAPVCLTPDCAQLSALVLSGLDATIDPCENFYNFSCGSWAQNTIIPDGSEMYEVFSTLDAYNKRKLRDVLVEMKGNGVEAIMKVQDLYKSCLDTDTTNSLGMLPLLEVLERVGGWPLAGVPSATEWSLNGSQFVQEKLLGSIAFFSLSVNMDMRDSSRYMLWVQNDGLSLSNPMMYTNETNTDELKNMVFTTLNMLNLNATFDNISDAADGVVDVERRLAQIYQDPDLLELEDVQFTTLDGLASLWPEYDWVQNLQDIFGSAGVDDIEGDEPILLITPLYFQNLSTALQGVDPRDLESYAKWQLIWNFMKLLDDACVDAFYSLERDTNPRAQIPTDRNEMCIGILETVMPVGLGRVYGQFVLPEGSRDRAAEMTTNVMQGFRERIASREWLDEETKERATRKVDLMASMIAYPDMIFNDDWLNMLYAGYDISSTNLFDNYYQFQINMVLRNLGQIHDKVDLWTTIPSQVMPTVVNAFNVPFLNQIFINEGIMGTPFFNPNWPLYFQYGALGVVLGHEITHGFDNNGREFNETGQMEEWWTNASVTNFVDRTQCYIDQYSEFSLFEIFVDGELTLGENIADNGGLIASYLAYNSAIQKNGDTSPTLPGLNYTAEQLFFIGFGQLWCTYTTPLAFQYQVTGDEHSPGPFRVLGSLMNSPEFAEAFQCPVGSPMNPVEKCTLW